MAPTLYRDTGYSLTHLIEDIKHGNIALPDIQRPFVWSAAKTRDLFDSMYRGYPVGTLMFWETGAEVGTRQVGGDQEQRVAKLLIVDGQQRLTSLFAVLTGSAVLTKNFDERRIRLAFRPSDETFEVTDAAIERDPEFVPDITALWGEGYKSTVRKFLHRLAESRGGELSSAEEDRLEERVDRVRDLRDFRFQIIELGTSANEEQVADIFVRINSEGIQLNQSDFILTLMSVHWEKGRRELEQFCRAAVDPKVSGASPKNPFIDPSPDQLLRVGVGVGFKRGRLQHVYSLLRGKDLDTGAVSAQRREAQFDRLREAQEDVLDLSNWHEFLKCLTAGGFRSRRMITSENALIFTYALWLIGRRDFGLDFRTLRPVISRWFFMAHTTGRYTTSPESQVEADLTRLSSHEIPTGEAFCAELDSIVRANFTGDYWEILAPEPAGHLLAEVSRTVRLLGRIESAGRGASVQRHAGQGAARPGHDAATIDRAASPVSEGPVGFPRTDQHPPGQRDREHGLHRLARQREHRCRRPTGLLAGHVREGGCRTSQAPGLLARTAGWLGTAGLCDVPGAKAATHRTSHPGRIRPPLGPETARSAGKHLGF